MHTNEKCPQCNAALNSSLLNPSFFWGSRKPETASNDDLVIAHGFARCSSCGTVCTVLFPVTVETAAQGDSFFAQDLDARLRSEGGVTITALIS